MGRDIPIGTMLSENMKPGTPCPPHSHYVAAVSRRITAKRVPEDGQRDFEHASKEKGVVFRKPVGPCGLKYGRTSLGDGELIAGAHLIHPTGSL